MTILAAHIFKMAREDVLACVCRPSRLQVDATTILMCKFRPSEYLTLHSQNAFTNPKTDSHFPKHVFWDATPLANSHLPYFRPWIQIHNCKTIEDVRNDGMTQWSHEALEEHVKQFHSKNPVGKPCMVFESRNFVASFVSELNLRSFPFDAQELRITIMSNTTSTTTFSHKVNRDETTGCAKPMFVNGKLLTTIKANLEADTLSEWDVLLQGGGKLDSAKESHIGHPSLAIMKYRFQEHDAALSAEGQVYQRLDMFVYVERELKNMIVSIILPSSLLSIASLSVFALPIDTNRGDRFSVLFTLILTIIANMFVTQSRLPYLAYFTWLDGVLLSFQIFVYAIVVETALITPIAESLKMDPIQADMIALWIFVAMFASQLSISWFLAWRLISHRKYKLRVAVEEANDSFLVEETRIAEFRKKHGLPAKIYEIPGLPAGSGEGEIVISLKE